MWEFIGFALPLSCTDVTASTWAYKIDGGILAVKSFKVWDDPTDKVSINGTSYISKPPKWEAEMDRWFTEQKEVEKTFDSPEEYVRYLKTVLALSE